MFGRMFGSSSSNKDHHGVSALLSLYYHFDTDSTVALDIIFADQSHGAFNCRDEQPTVPVFAKDGQQCVPEHSSVPRQHTILV